MTGLVSVMRPLPTPWTGLGSDGYLCFLSTAGTPSSFLNGRSSFPSLFRFGIPLLMLLGHALVKSFLFIYKYINFYFFKPPLFDHGHAPLIAMIFTKQEDTLNYFFLKKKDYLYLKDNINKRTGKGEGFWRRKKPCCPFPSHAALSHQSHFKPTHSIFYLFIYFWYLKFSQINQ